MKILIENINFYPLLGGVETYVENVSKEFIKLGHKVTVLCSNPNNKEKETEDHKRINIVRYKTPMLPKGLIWSWPLSHQKKIKEKLNEITRKQKFDFVLTRSLIFVKPNLEFFSKNKIVYIPPCVIKLFYKKSMKTMSLRILPKYLLNSILLSKMESSALKNLNKISTLSKLIKNQIIQQHRIKKEKIKVINPGIDLGKFKVVSSKKPNVVFMGRLTGEKNVISLIKTFKYVKKGKLILVGGGMDEEKLKKKIGKEKIMSKIKFMGWRKNPENFYAKSKIFVLPSIYESFGHVLLEAMASGLPCIAFQPDDKKIITASDEIIINGKTGFLVKDEKEMAEKIDLLLSDNELREKMGKEARRQAEKYSWKKCAEEILKFVKE